MADLADFARFERFRAQLQLIARISWDKRMHAKVDPSDIVQQTLTQAFEARNQFRGDSEAEFGVWLRKILANVMNHAYRDLRAGKRDIRRDQSLDQLVENTVNRIAGLPSSDESSPIKKVEISERANRIAKAVEQLPGDQRDAIVQRFWQDKSLAEVADQMDRSPAAIAGLVRRGVKTLRTQLRDIDLS